jgi:hypothetical protein
VIDINHEFSSGISVWPARSDLNAAAPALRSAGRIEQVSQWQKKILAGGAAEGVA